MSFQPQELPVNFSGFTYGFAGIVTIVIIAGLAQCPNLDAFPTVGSSGFLDSWLAGFKFLFNSADIVQEGYKKHKSAPFKVADRYSWIVILSDRNHIEELRRAPDDELSFVEAVNELLNTRYMLGDKVHDSPYHVAVTRSQLTRNIRAMYPETRDEVVAAFDEVLDLRGYEWKTVSALSAIQKVVCRTINRTFVGLPLCRNPDWIDLNIQYTIDVVKTGAITGLFPKLLRPLVARFFTAIARDSARGLKHLAPMIEERLNHLNECGDKWAGKPNDLLSWLMEEINGPQLTAEYLTSLLLVANFTAIHTTSNSITHALFYLAANSQYIPPLREEVEAVVEREGWSKASLGKMRKVDSFLRECQRMEGLSAVSVARKAMKDYTFSDGTFIPKGTLIGVATGCLHRDERFYQNADVFKPFRFAEMHEGDLRGAKNQLVSTAIDYLPFGHGKRACPGRFFAATVMKSLVAHIVTTYDIKLEDGATPPRTGNFFSLNLQAKVLFRKRVD